MFKEDQNIKDIFKKWSQGVIKDTFNKKSLHQHNEEDLVLVKEGMEMLSDGLITFARVCIGIQRRQIEMKDTDCRALTMALGMIDHVGELSELIKQTIYEIWADEGVEVIVLPEGFTDQTKH